LTCAARPSRSILSSGVKGVNPIGKSPRSGLASAARRALFDSASPVTPKPNICRKSRLSESPQFVIVFRPPVASCCYRREYISTPHRSQADGLLGNPKQKQWPEIETVYRKTKDERRLSLAG